jgi:hypothetical protein
MVSVEFASMQQLIASAVKLAVEASEKAKNRTTKGQESNDRNDQGTDLLEMIEESRKRGTAEIMEKVREEIQKIASAAVIPDQIVPVDQVEPAPTPANLTKEEKKATKAKEKSL